MTSKINCRINGMDVTLHSSADEPLLFVLRNQLDLKAVHFGCGLEQCGACVASVNGEPRYTCTLPLSLTEHAAIVTPEGLAGDPVGDALLEAFEAEHVGQCGYCLGGMVMSAFALLKNDASPTRSTIVQVLDRHLCRCGAHPAILRAVERAAASLRGSTR